MKRPLVESQGPLRRVLSREQETVTETADGLVVTRLVDVLECGHREGNKLGLSGEPTQTFQRKRSRSCGEPTWPTKRRCRGCRDGDPT